MDSDSEWSSEDRSINPAEATIGNPSSDFPDGGDILVLQETDPSNSVKEIAVGINFEKNCDGIAARQVTKRTSPESVFPNLGLEPTIEMGLVQQEGSSPEDNLSRPQIRNSKEAHGKSTKNFCGQGSQTYPQAQDV